MLARMAFWFGAMGGGDRRDREGGGLGAIFMLLLAPFAAMLIQLWVSRTREYEADASGARLTGNPYGLASALEKISGESRRVPLLASPSSAHMFIIAPLLGGQSFASLFSTHPPVKERIQRLIGRPSVYGVLQ
jgi:heat shock protein HtpX